MLYVKQMCPILLYASSSQPEFFLLSHYLKCDYVQLNKYIFLFIKKYRHVSFVCKSSEKYPTNSVVTKRNVPQTQFTIIINT